MFHKDNNHGDDIREPQFQSFSSESQNEQIEAAHLQALRDIPLQVQVELGRTKLPVENILQLTKGSIIELDRLAGEPVEIMVNEKPIAKGEVVVIEENFGVRVTEILNRTDRLNQFKR